MKELYFQPFLSIIYNKIIKIEINKKISEIGEFISKLKDKESIISNEISLKDKQILKMCHEAASSQVFTPSTDNLNEFDENEQIIVVHKRLVELFKRNTENIIKKMYTNLNYLKLSTQIF